MVKKNMQGFTQEEQNWIDSTRLWIDKQGLTIAQIDSELDGNREQIGYHKLLLDNLRKTRKLEVKMLKDGQRALDKWLRENKKKKGKA